VKPRPQPGAAMWQMTSQISQVKDKQMDGHRTYKEKDVVIA